MIWSKRSRCPTASGEVQSAISVILRGEAMGLTNPFLFECPKRFRESEKESEFFTKQRREELERHPIFTRADDSHQIVESTAKSEVTKRMRLHRGLT